MTLFMARNWEKFSYKVNFSIWIWSKHKINQILGMDPHPVRYKSIPAYFIANIALQFEYSSFSLFPLSHILNKHPVLKKPLYFQNLSHFSTQPWAGEHWRRSSQPSKWLLYSFSLEGWPWSLSKARPEKSRPASKPPTGHCHGHPQHLLSPQILPPHPHRPLPRKWGAAPCLRRGWWRPWRGEGRGWGVRPPRAPGWLQGSEYLPLWKEGCSITVF